MLTFEQTKDRNGKPSWKVIQPPALYAASLVIDETVGRIEWLGNQYHFTTRAPNANVPTFSAGELRDIAEFIAALMLSGPSTTEDELALANHQLACQLADAREQLARRT